MEYSNITISGKICTGKTTLRNLLSKKLNWQTFSTGEIFRDYVKKKDISLDAAEEQNEKLTKKIDSQVRDLLKTKKNLIVDSWLAGITAKGTPGVLKVLLTCQNQIRYKRYAKREKITYQEAKQRVDKRFSNWSKKIKKIHHLTDFLDEDRFDMVIDTSYIIPLAVARQVLAKLS